MSKFFARASELTSSESESDSEDDKPVQQKATTVEAKKTTTTGPKKQYMKGFDESSESDEEIRVVVAQKDKRLERLNGILGDLKNHLKINDFVSIQNDFEKLTVEI